MQRLKREGLEMDIEAVGTVHKEADEEPFLELELQFKHGMDGIKLGDRLQLLYWMHKLASDDRKILKVHPQGDTSRPRQGVFGLRSPMRPNPIGVSIVEVTRIEGTRIYAAALDALDGSPIIDIKSAPS
jgi:L-fuculose-phosphate aldolase